MSEQSEQSACSTACRSWPTSPTSPAPSVLVRVDFNVPLQPCADGSGMSRWPTTSASGPPCPPSSTCSTGGPSVTACTHLGRPTAIRSRAWDLAPGPRGTGPPGPQGRAAREPALRPRRGGRRSGHSSRSWSTGTTPTSTTPSGFPTGATPRWSDHRHSAAQRRRSPRSSARSRCSAGLLGTPARPFVAVVGGAKVADKLRCPQGAPRPQSTPWWWGAGWPSPSWPPPATTSAARWSMTEQIDECAALASVGEGHPAAHRHRGPRPGSEPFGAGRRRRTRRGCPRSAPSGPTSPTGWRGLDIGPPDGGRATGRSSPRRARCCGTVPMGVFEDERFAAGTDGVARGGRGQSAASPSSAAVTVSPPSMSSASEDRIDFISTGGGASLELLEYGDLPGLAALRAARPTPQRPGAPGGRWLGAVT